MTLQDPASVVVASTVQPGVSASGTAPTQTAPPSNIPGVCNSYLPEDTTLNRFMFVVNFYASNGFYILLDNQFNLDQTAINNQQQWITRVSFRLVEWYCLPRQISKALWSVTVIQYCCCSYCGPW